MHSVPLYAPPVPHLETAIQITNCVDVSSIPRSVVGGRSLHKLLLKLTKFHWQNQNQYAQY